MDQTPAIINHFPQNPNAKKVTEEISSVTKRFAVKFLRAIFQKAQLEEYLGSIGNKPG